MQEKIKKRYKLIMSKGEFIEQVKKIEGFSNCADWVRTDGRIPVSKENKFLEFIEKRLLEDEKIRQINVDFYKKL